MHVGESVEDGRVQHTGAHGRAAKSWQKNKLTIEIYLYIFKKGAEGVSAEVHHFFCPPSPQ